MFLAKQTYSSNLLSLKDLAINKNYKFEKVSINDLGKIIEFFEKYNPDLIIHFAQKAVPITASWACLNLLTPILSAPLNCLKSAENTDLVKMANYSIM